MTVNKIKLMIAAIVVSPLMLISVFQNPTVNGAAVVDDTPAYYKAKCAMCHGQTAEKKFDATKADDVLVEIVMKGNADAKPPMPGYEAKGMTMEQAQAIVAHMKSLRAPAQ